MKRIVASVCAAACLLGGVGLTNDQALPLLQGLSLTAEAATVGDWTYHLGSDSQGSFAIIDAYVGTATTVYTPTKLNGYPVKAISSFGVKRRSTLKVLYISQGVTRIYDYAFQNFTALTDVQFANSIDRLGNYAFHDCTSLKRVNFVSYTSSVLNLIGTGCFEGCGSLQSIEFPYALRTINSGAFRDCGAMTSVKPHQGLLTIGSSAFKNCSSVRFSITLPTSVQSIGYSAFENCSSLPSVTIGGNTTLGLYIYEDAFKNCYSLRTVTIGKRKVTQVYDGAFENCSSLTRLNFPTVTVNNGTSSYVTELKDNIIFERNALKNCPNLSSQFYTDHTMTSDTYNRGSAKILSGTQNIVLVFVNAKLDVYTRNDENVNVYDHTELATWTPTEKEQIREFAKTACSRITGWTNSYGIYGGMNYSGDIIDIGGVNTLTIDIKDTVAMGCSATNSQKTYSYYYLQEQIYKHYKGAVPANTVFLTCIDYAPGRSATIPARENSGMDSVDQAIIMGNRADEESWVFPMTHETLHLYGAADWYNDQAHPSHTYSSYANPSDVMFAHGARSLNTATANMLGWNDVFFQSDFTAYQNFNEHLVAVKCND